MSEKRLKLYGWLVLVIALTAVGAVLVISCGVKLLTAYWPVFVSTLPAAFGWIIGCTIVTAGLILIKIIDDRIGDTKYNEKRKADDMIFRSTAN